MEQIIAKHFEDTPYYQGPNAIAGIKFHSAGRDLGITAWGMNVIEIAAGCTNYPEHDHAKDGQEEAYIVLLGDGVLKADDTEIKLTQGMLVRVGAPQKRKILPGSQGIVILAIGGTPGKAYQ